MAGEPLRPGRGVVGNPDEPATLGASAVAESELRAALEAVVDPELGDNIVALGMVRDIAIDAEGRVRVEVALTIAACPLRSQIERDVRGRLEHLDGVHAVEIVIVAMDAEARAEVMARARWKARDDAPATAVDPDTVVLAIASGKGGVGKSSVTVNLAVALASRGLTVGVLDADIWGFSVPRLLGMEGDIEARAGKMVPSNSPSGPEPCAYSRWGSWPARTGPSCGAASCSTGPCSILGGRALGAARLPADRPAARDRRRADGLARMLPRTQLLVVTTPPLAAQKVASRAADMARRGYLRVAGVIENMSDFTCEHGATYALFGSGGGARLADELGVPLIGSIPLHPDMAACGDAGHRWRPSPGPWPWRSRHSPSASRATWPRAPSRRAAAPAGRAGGARRRRGPARATSGSS